MLNIDRKVYDIIGVGIGPFNLGMAVMAEQLPQLNCIFFDQSKEFNWHPGLMLPGARLQVPFYADLITLIDPSSKLTYLYYLKEKQRMFRFSHHEQTSATRTEYNDYCRWVVSKLDNLRFHHKVVDVNYDERDQLYTVMVHNLSSDEMVFYCGKHLVIGVGSVPYVPECSREGRKERKGCAKNAMQTDKKIIHSSEYLFHKDSILEHQKITVVGSGQSAAEIFYDLLNYADHLENLCWFTRSHRIYAMENSKFSYEHTSEDYIDHFYSLTNEQKRKTLKRHDPLYKGINFSLLNEIYDRLYLMSLEMDTSFIKIYPKAELQGINCDHDGLALQFFHMEQERNFEHKTEVVIMATGYESCVPEFLNSIKERIQFLENGKYDVKRNYSIDHNNSVFVQNAELHSHGFSAPDLGMGPYRNATILNAILGYELFVLEKGVTFQRFGC
jgi:lysine N6-hydroxylase